MNDSNTQSSNTHTSPALGTANVGSARNVRGQRLSSSAIAILVIGSVLGAGAVGAVIGGASSQRTAPSSDLPLSTGSELQPIPIGGSSLGTSTGKTDSLSLGSVGIDSVGSLARQGFLAPSFAAQTITERAVADQVTPTSKLTTLTLAPRPRPGSVTTIKPSNPTNTTTKRRVVATTTTLAEVGPPDINTTDTTDTTDNSAESTEAPIIIPTTPPRTATTTRPPRQQGQQQAHQLGSGIVVVPASGYSIVKKFDGGEVVIGNQFSYIHTWVEQAGDTSNLPATQVVDYISNKILPQGLQDVQADSAAALKPSKTSISSMASAGYRALLSGQQGSSDVEGFSFSAVRPDGTVLLFFAVVKSGSFQQAQGPIGQMLGSILASM